jgi:hypothetical protein
MFTLSGLRARRTRGTVGARNSRYPECRLLHCMSQLMVTRPPGTSAPTSAFEGGSGLDAHRSAQFSRMFRCRACPDIRAPLPPCPGSALSQRGYLRVKKRIVGHSATGWHHDGESDEIRWDASRSSVRPLHDLLTFRDAYRKRRCIARRGCASRSKSPTCRSPHATSETGRTLMLLLGFDVALMRRSTIISIS